MPLTNPPFMPQKGQPAYHLRESTVEELEQHRRMIAATEAMRPEKNCSNPSGCDSVPAPSEKA